MKTFEIKTLMFVAAVACLPIACGTSSVSGPDTASLAGSEISLSALSSPPAHHAPPAAAPAASPAPSTGPSVPPTAPLCLAYSVEIVTYHPRDTFRAIVTDAKGVEIVDSSCAKLTWLIQAGIGDSDNTPGSAASITVQADNHFARLSGPAGDYKIGVMASNGATGSRLVTLR